MTQQLTPLDTEKLIIMSDEQFQELFLYLSWQIIVAVMGSVAFTVASLLLAVFLSERILEKAFDFIEYRASKVFERRAGKESTKDSD